MKSLFTEQVRLGDIDKLGIKIVNLSTLIECGAIHSLTRRVKIFLSGTLKKPIKVQNIAMSNAVKTIIEEAGGSVENNKMKGKN